jgi:drug/metabolite transporter (DMT)-like permease
MSVVYPLARGLAPVLVLAGVVAFTGASTSAGQVLGVLLVGGGVLLVRGLRRGRGVAWGLAIACCIASYTVVDKHGVAHASPLPYLEVITAFTGTVYAAGLAVARGPTVLRAALGRRAIVAGLATFAGYGLVLAALQLASAASVAAVRETSVLVAALLAAVVLEERVTRWRIAGAALVAGGVALLSLA